MRNALDLKITVGVLLAIGGVAWIVGSVASCGTAPTPFLVHGPATLGNEPPTLNIIEPSANLTTGQGDPFLIQWTDRDRDNNARITFSLVSVGTNESVLVASGIEENDASGPDLITVSTILIPPGSYNLLGVIDDGENPPVEVFAELADATAEQRVIIRIVGAGEGPQTEPPIVAVTQPGFNLSVAQEDTLRIAVQPSTLEPNAAVPFDPDSDLRLFILLDMDQDPNNDDPANADPSQIIVLQEQTIGAGDFDTISFDIRIDLAVIPARPTGEPYFIRATVDDATNPRVHSYAVGTISVVQLAAGTVDLFDIGRTKSGARFYGFNPGASLGSSLSSVGDFDADGTGDFVLVARFGNPQNTGPVGEAYLIYGQNEVRFGGTLSVNTISDIVSGAIFQAPPVRDPFPRQRTCLGGSVFTDPGARSDGITDVSFVRDLTGDGRPDILLGLPHVHGAFDSTDYDPSDEDFQGNPCGCFPDLLVNNLTETDQNDPVDVQFYAGGMAIMVNSQNRDNSPRISPRPTRLATTSIALELVGQRRFVLSAGGLSAAGSILARADNADLGPALGNDPDEQNRIAGARFVGGGFEFEDPFAQGQPPREGLFGQSFRSMGDLNSDGLDELVISAPRNERYLADLLTTFGFFSTHWQSSRFRGSIVVLPGLNYNQEFWRDSDDDNGTARIPLLDHHIHPIGRCSAPPRGRHTDIPADWFEIFAEGLDDMLGQGGSAGDFNQDGLDDVLCGAPLNDRSSSAVDTGAAYIIYSRTPFGGVNLANADDPILRPPMLRIRGEEVGDQIGWRQVAGLDVNGDRIDDVFIASPRADFGDVTRTTCAADFNLDGIITQNDLTLLAFDNCAEGAGDEVFSDDPCKAFDYDNDGDIDADDRCVFCCLSGECESDEECVFGLDSGDCCANLVDNGFIGIIFGGVFIDGDRRLSQLATSQLPGVRFFGSGVGHRAGIDISSARDFNQDGFGDILIAVPGEVRRDSAGRERLGVVYLIFGGVHLRNTTWNLSEVGSDELPGIVFLSPYVKGFPNEAAPTTVGFIGDINSDGFGDIAIGNPKADFVDLSFPQGPNAPGSDPSAGRRSNTGDAYVIYGNNFGSNRAGP